MTQSKHTLTIALKHASQVAVYDGRGIQLVRRYFPAGKVVTVSGAPPFSIRLRVSEGIRVLYDGKAVKVPAPVSGGRIQFRLGNTKIDGENAVYIDSNLGRDE